MGKSKKSGKLGIYEKKLAVVDDVDDNVDVDE